MHQILISPKVGIGPIKLGMTEPEVQDILKTDTEFRRSDVPFAPSYLESLFSKFEYGLDNKVKFIEISNPFNDFNINCLYDGLDVFKIKADDLVKEIDKRTNYVRDHESEMGYLYNFSEIQMSFWRPSVITEDVITSIGFLTELSHENQEIEKRNLFFSTVSIAVPGY